MDEYDDQITGCPTERSPGTRRMNAALCCWSPARCVLIPLLLGGSEIWARLHSFPLQWLLIMSA